jgi:transcriptional regulator with XRE-family HTH domain
MCGDVRYFSGVARTLSLPFSPERLVKARERAGLTQGGLADRTTDTERVVSRTTITHLECGDRKPSAPVLKALADALGIAVDELLDYDSQEKGDDGE